MIFSKFIKLITHFVRYPVDILLWPVSILFGWFHGLIKVYAAITLSVVRKPGDFELDDAANRLNRLLGAVAPMPMPATLEG